MNDYWNDFAKETAKELKKEYPDWDEETLISETIECVDFAFREELCFIEKNLRKHLAVKSSK